MRSLKEITHRAVKFKASEKNRIVFKSLYSALSQPQRKNKLVFEDSVVQYPSLDKSALLN